MDQSTQNEKLYELLVNIKNNPMNLIDRDISREDESIYKHLIKLDLVINLIIENYYSGPVINAEYALITENGYAFLKKIDEQKRLIRMTKKNRYIQLQVLLERIENGEIGLSQSNPRVRETDYLDLFQFAIANSFIKGVSVIPINGKIYAIAGEPRITPEGYEVLETSFNELEKNQNIMSQTFNFNGGDFKNSTFGNENIQNNKE